MKTFFRTAALFTAFSLPLASGCTTREDQSGNDVQAVKPNDNVQVIKTKDVLDKERKKIEQDERILASDLHKWANDLSDLLWESYLVIDPKQGESPNRVTYGRLLTKANDRFLGCPFLTISTNKEIIEEFSEVLDWSIKGARYMKKYIDLPEEVLTKRLENGIKRRNDLYNLKYTEQKMKDAIQGHLKDYSIYKKSLPGIIDQSAKLLLLIETFNKDASLAKQPPYEYIWMTAEHLQELRSLNLTKK